MGHKEAFVHFPVQFCSSALGVFESDSVSQETVYPNKSLLYLKKWKKGSMRIDYQDRFKLEDVLFSNNSLKQRARIDLPVNGFTLE